MNFTDIIKTLPCAIISKGKDFPNTIIKNAVTSDMMSEVLTTDKEDVLLITSLSSHQTIRTADSVGALGVIIVNDTPIQTGMAELAEDLGITLLQTDVPAFETCVAIGKLLNL